jgi:transcriptional regulator with XRE-family HTH domain
MRPARGAARPEGSFAAFAERVAEALDPRKHALAIRYDETSASLAVPEQFERLRDTAVARLDGIRATLSRRGRIGGFAAWLKDMLTRAFREDETANSDLGSLARSASSGAAAVIDLHARKRPSPRPVDAHVGLRLRQRRWMNGLTREQLAELSGFASDELAGYETGQDPVFASRLWEIASALDVPVTYFFEGAEGQDVAADGAHGATLPDDEAVELVRAYYAIPEDQRSRLWDLARLLRQAA